jgi:hypothetical protein
MHTHSERAAAQGRQQLEPLLVSFVIFLSQQLCRHSGGPVADACSCALGEWLFAKFGVSDDQHRWVHTHAFLVQLPG